MLVHSSQECLCIFTLNCGGDGVVKGEKVTVVWLKVVIEVGYDNTSKLF